MPRTKYILTEDQKLWNIKNWLEQTFPGMTCGTFYGDYKGDRVLEFTTSYPRKYYGTSKHGLKVTLNGGFRVRDSVKLDPTNYKRIGYLVEKRVRSIEGIKKRQEDNEARNALLLRFLESRGLISEAEAKTFSRSMYTLTVSDPNDNPLVALTYTITDDSIIQVHRRTTETLEVLDTASPFFWADLIDNEEKKVA